MRIMPINNINYRFSIKNSIVQNNETNKANVNFNGFGYYMAYLLGRESWATLSKSKQYDFIRSLEEHIQSYNREKFTDGIRAITRTPNKLYDATSYSRLSILGALKGSIEYIRVLRWMGLQKIDLIEDNSAINIQTKKDFFNSLLDNGHPISPMFVKKFKELKDCYYKTFKESTVDKLLYSPSYNQVPKITSQYVRSLYRDDKFEKEYEWTHEGLLLGLDPNDSSQRKAKAVAQAYQDLKLIATLDKSIYSSFIGQRQASIKKLQDMVKKEIDYVHSYQLPNPCSSWLSFYNDFYDNLNTI